MINIHAEPVVISCVSGKGGVGKTLIASNLAWIIGQANKKVLIVDLDFRNLGATSLFAAQGEIESATINELLVGDIDYTKPFFVDANVVFLPASFSADIASTDIVTTDVKQYQSQLDRVVANIQSEFEFDVIVFDCHGGIDELSIAATMISQYVLVLTEADPMTFGGTLRLLDSYVNFFASLAKKPIVRLIVNRVSPRFKFDDLKQLYDDLLSETDLGRYEAKILSFLPYESYVSECMVEFPFPIKVATKSVLRRKIELITLDLFAKSNPDLVSRSIRFIFNRLRFKKKIQKTIISIEERGNRSVRSMFAFFSTLVWLLGPVSLGLYLNYGDKLGEILEADVDYWFAVVLIVLVLGFILLLPAIVTSRVYSAYADELTYLKNLNQILKDEFTWHRRMKMLKLIIISTSLALSSAVLWLFLPIFLFLILSGF